MIYFTGDTHGEQGRFISGAIPGEYAFGENDVLIVTGDFSYLFLDTAEERIFLKHLEEKPYTIAFVDGNHENFPAIYSYPEVEMWGGRVDSCYLNIIMSVRFFNRDVC